MIKKHLFLAGTLLANAVLPAQNKPFRIEGGVIIGRYGGGGEDDEAMDKKLAKIFEKNKLN